jgi:hypothetical protein
VAISVDGFFAGNEVLKNIALTFDGILDMMRASQNSLHGILMFDELAIEK